MPGIRVEESIARVLDARGRFVGAAFVAAGGYVVTCAHVVNSALGLARRTPSAPPPDASVALVFPFTGDGTTRHTARIRHRAPGTDWRPETDLAVLELAGGDADVPELPVAEPDGRSAVQVQMCGAASDDADGLRHVLGEMVGRNAGSRWQVDVSGGGTAVVAGGFSGGPVWRRGTSEVIGVVRAATGDGRRVECLDLAALARHVPASPAFTRTWTGREPLWDFGRLNRVYFWGTAAMSLVVLAVMTAARPSLPQDGTGAWELLPAGVALACFLAFLAQARFYAWRIRKRMTEWTLRITGESITVTSSHMDHETAWADVADVRLAYIKADPLYQGSAMWPYRLMGLHVRLTTPSAAPQAGSPAGWPIAGGDPTQRDDGVLPL